MMPVELIPVSSKSKIYINFSETPQLFAMHMVKYWPTGKLQAVTEAYTLTEN